MAIPLAMQAQVAPDLFGSYQRGVQTAQQNQAQEIQQRLAELSAGRQEDIAGLQQTMAQTQPGTDDYVALQQQLTSLDPTLGKNYMDIQSAQKQSEQAEIERQAQLAGRLAQGVLQSEDKDTAYQQAKQMAASQGVDVTALPEQYTPETETMLNQLVGRARSVQEQVTSQERALYTPTAEEGKRRFGEEMRFKWANLKERNDQAMNNLKLELAQAKMASKQAPDEFTKKFEAEKAKTVAEDINNIQTMNANLPSTLKKVNQLKALSSDMSDTMTGRAMDSLLKEFGVSTKAKTSRAKYKAIIDNMILPQLKATFGSAFTEKEGERLTATLGDPDATYEEKMGQLNSFIENKIDTMQNLGTKIMSDVRGRQAFETYSPELARKFTPEYREAQKAEADKQRQIKEAQQAQNLQQAQLLTGGAIPIGKAQPQKTTGDDPLGIF